MDVVLNKVLSVVKSEINAYRNTPEASEVILQLDERERWYIPGGAALRNTDTCKRVLTGGRLLSTFEMAELGSLQRDLEVTYTAISGADKAEALDTAVLEHLKETTRAELDCQVCYSLFLDPFTTPCGHTFCRKCLHRVLDHSNLCPVCRRVLAIPPGMTAQQAPSNILLGKLLAGLCPEAVAARIETARIEDQVGMGELDTSLFVCTLSFPSVPTFLHIFEPRYRLMIRRAIETGNRKFGMLLHNPSRSAQGDLGAVPFYQYGTLLHIINMHLMDDGRSIIETVGISRFRVLRHGTMDGYTVGKIERVDDMTLAEEEALEAAETTEAAQRQPTSREPQRLHTGEELMGMSTQELMGIGTTFVKTMREQSAPWLHRRVFQAFGECPEDPAIFPWWFASVLPIADGEKYKLLSTSSVRERLKICAGWIAQLEARRRYASFVIPLAYQ